MARWMPRRIAPSEVRAHAGSRRAYATISGQPGHGQRHGIGIRWRCRANWHSMRSCSVEIQVARFDASSFAPNVAVSDADLEAYLRANPAKFQQPRSGPASNGVVLDLTPCRRQASRSMRRRARLQGKTSTVWLARRTPRQSHPDRCSRAAPADEKGCQGKAIELLAEPQKTPAASPNWRRKRLARSGLGCQLAAISTGFCAAPWSNRLKTPFLS